MKKKKDIEGQLYIPGYRQRDDAPYESTSMTSQQAALEQTKPRRRAKRFQILEYIEGKKLVGTTCDEIEHALKLRHQTASARVRELWLDTEICKDGTTRKTSSGSLAIVYYHSRFRELLR